MTEDDFGRGYSAGGIAQAIRSFEKRLEGVETKVDDLQQSLSSLTGGHKAMLWVFSAAAACAAMLATLYSGLFSRHP